MNRRFLISCIRITLPVFFGYIALGTAFGLVVAKSGYPWWLAPLMSIFIYAGSGQFVAISLFSAGTPLAAILITEAFVNIRHIVYGLSLITKYKDCGKWKPYAVFGLTDETYSLVTTIEKPEGIAPGVFYGTITLLNQCYWLTGSVLGVLLGKLLPFDLTGVDFSLTALFAVLTVEQIKKNRDFVPSAIGAACTLGAVVLWRCGIIGNSSNILIIAIFTGILGLFITKRRDRSTEHAS